MRCCLYGYSVKSPSYFLEAANETTYVAFRSYSMPVCVNSSDIL